MAFGATSVTLPELAIAGTVALKAATLTGMLVGTLVTDHMNAVWLNVCFFALTAYSRQLTNT